MMHDSLDPRDAAREPASEPRSGPSSEPVSGDREVPLAGAEIPSAVHAYLDGDSVSEAALSAAEREMALWKRIASETVRRLKMVTPAHVPAQILAKLADD